MNDIIGTYFIWGLFVMLLTVPAWPSWRRRLTEWWIGWSAKNRQGR
jgi:hypothetical protein